MMEKQTPAKAMLVLLLLHVLCLGGHAEDDQCYPEIRVKRNAGWKVLEMNTLKINCPVKYCDPTPDVTWGRLVDNNTCTQLTENPNVKIWQELVSNEDNLIISYVEIKEATKDYSGFYRCEVSATTTGHSISVTVTGVDYVERTTYNKSSVSDTTAADLEWLPYLFIGGGATVALLVSLICLYAFKMSSQNKKVAPQLNIRDTIPQDLVTIVMYSTAEDFQSRFMSDN